MKSTDTIDDVIIKLAEIKETEGHQPAFSIETVSIRKLLALFEEAKHHESEDVVRNLFEQAGYGWVSKLGKAEIQAMSTLSNFRSDELFSIQQIPEHGSAYLFTEEEFMNLIPANAYFH